MQEGRHIGTTQKYDLIKLSKNWRCRDGLEYPLTLIKVNGLRRTFYSYEEHHKYIKQLFKN